MMMSLRGKVKAEHVASASAFAAVAAVLTVLLTTSLAQTPKAVTLPEGVPALGLQVMGRTELFTDSFASLRVIATDHATDAPLRGAYVTVRLAEPDAKAAQTVFRGRTDRLGTLDASFDIPDMQPGSYLLQVSADSAIGNEKVERKIDLKREYQILLTTDKPLYQPNQIIHIRALALRKPKLTAAARKPLTLEVMDAKGNKVFKRTSDTDDFGISSADFQLADEVNMGRYTIRALLDESKSEKTVTVDRYVLPKFKVDVKCDKDYYLPGETVKGTVQADYFFGKPVADAEAKVKLSTFDVELTELDTITGRTDDNGTFKFESKLPAHFVGQPLEQGNAYLQIDVSLKDQADHIEKKTKTAQVAKDPIQITVVPEAGEIVPKVPNGLFLMTTYPDGSAAQCDLTIQGAPQTLKTDALGIARHEIVPETAPYTLTVEARDERGNRATKTEQLAFDPEHEGVLLRTDKAVYRVGDEMKCTVLSPTKRGTIYLDVIRDRQTMLTRAVDLKDGKAATQIDIGPEMEGTTWVSAYRIKPDGDIVRDTRALYIDPADDLKIDIKAAKDSYLPGSDAEVKFRVLDEAGKGVAAAIGLTVVDESVFALQDLQPGMEKVYFLLEQELMQPKYEIHEFTPMQIVQEPVPGTRPARDEAERRDEAARFLFASAKLPMEEGTFYVDTFATNLAKVKVEWAKRMVKDAETIQNALQKYIQKHNGQPPTVAEGLEPLVEDKLLPANAIRDQWARPYVLEKDFVGGDRIYQAVISSWGPDGTQGTLDDIRGIPPWPWALGALDEKGAGEMLLQGGMGRGGMMPGMAGRGFLAMDAARAAPVAGAMPMMAMAEEPEAMAKAAMPAPAAAMTGAPPAQAPAKAPVRIREYFPETMYNDPALITDGSGAATLTLPMADSITTWRLTAVANSTLGQLGSATAPLKCFQDFFIDLDLPVALTKGDQVSIPVAVYNYLPVSQKVRLELTKEDWFDVSGATTASLEIGSNDVDVAYFTITAKEIGSRKLTVHAYGSKMDDAIRREIEIEPNGQLREVAINGRLDKDLTQTVTIPAGAIEDASNILVKVYPGIFAQAVEGLDSMLRMPFGCFEQTSSSTYPNVLVLDYMKATQQVTPEIRMKAEGFINTGYQRLLTFEVKGGGFSWFGDAPANRVLTAYGLLEFSDMAKVYEVDESVIQRTQQWLLGQQQADGSWKPDPQYLHQESWSRIQNSSLLPSAYVAWALVDSGAKAPGVAKGADYLRKHLDEAKDAYTVALICNALVAADPEGAVTEKALGKLIDMAKHEDEKMWWEAGISTATNARGNTADIEATGLAGYALIASGRHPAESTQALNYLIAAKSAQGIWGSTQGTVLALKCMVASLKGATQKINAEISVIANGQNADGFALDETNSDVMHQVDLRKFVRPGDNAIKIKFSGKGSALYTIVGKYYVPWQGADLTPGEGLMSIDVKYDKTTLQKDDTVTATATIKQNRPGISGMVVVDLGVPPGFQVEAGDLAELVGSNVIQKYSLTGRQIIVYLEQMDSKKPVQFSYRLKAKFPIRAQTPKSRVYEYYNPDNQAFSKPVEIQVKG
jgi:uncharacterized protein YfaS (alpha-2-macroglobulin family)